MTMNEQTAALSAVIVSIGTAIGAGWAAYNQRKEAKTASRRQDDLTQTIIDQGVQMRDLKKELENAKKHTDDCERDRREMSVQLSRMEGSLTTMERLATMQDKVPHPFVEFIREIADDNSEQTARRMKAELAEALSPVFELVRIMRDAQRPRALGTPDPENAG